jgi:oxygen-independent coproporphyrinogen III oxidase
MKSCSAEVPPDAGLITKYSRPGPRYTSYPTAPHWSSRYGPGEYRRALGEMGGRVGTDPSSRPVSVYIHVPFCERRCTFCACNVVISRAHERGIGYIDAVTREMDAVVAAAGARPAVTQMHWGGGTPTWLSADELALLHDRVAERFAMLPGREQSVEIDPRVTGPEQLDALRQRGLNRVSMGVQDFDEKVQRAVNRVQSVEQTAAIIDHARSIGVEGVNIDLIYGLPHQSPAGFAASVRRVIELAPDRLALYNFAHLPDRLRHHAAIRPETLPDAATRIELFRTAAGLFGEAGYEMIGLDHFAASGDELTLARAEGTLQRNFMGYTTRAGHDLLGFGVSSIGRVGRDFAQNLKTTTNYNERAGDLPVDRGLRLSDEDLRRERIIQSIMCYGRAEISEPGEGGGLVADPEVSGRLGELRADGLIELDGSVLAVTQLGRFFLRNIAMVFDAYLGAAPGETSGGSTVQVTYSRTV